MYVEALSALALRNTLLSDEILKSRWYPIQSLTVMICNYGILQSWC